MAAEGGCRWWMEVVRCSNCVQIIDLAIAPPPLYCPPREPSTLSLFHVWKKRERKQLHTHFPASAFSGLSPAEKWDMDDALMCIFTPVIYALITAANIVIAPKHLLPGLACVIYVSGVSPLPLPPFLVSLWGWFAPFETGSFSRRCPIPHVCLHLIMLRMPKNIAEKGRFPCHCHNLWSDFYSI